MSIISQGLGFKFGVKRTSSATASQLITMNHSFNIYVISYQPTQILISYFLNYFLKLKDRDCTNVDVAGLSLSDLTVSEHAECIMMRLGKKELIVWADGVSRKGVALIRM